MNCAGATIRNALGEWRIEFRADGTLLYTHSPPPPRPVRGVGDVVERVASAVGIPKCRGCESRRKALNKALPL